MLYAVQLGISTLGRYPLKAGEDPARHGMARLATTRWDPRQGVHFEGSDTYGPKYALGPLGSYCSLNLLTHPPEVGPTVSWRVDIHTDGSVAAWLDGGKTAVCHATFAEIANMSEASCAWDQGERPPIAERFGREIGLFASSCESAFWDVTAQAVAPITPEPPFGDAPMADPVMIEPKTGVATGKVKIVFEIPDCTKGYSINVMAVPNEGDPVPIAGSPFELEVTCNTNPPPPNDGVAKTKVELPVGTIQIEITEAGGRAVVGGRIEVVP